MKIILSLVCIMCVQINNASDFHYSASSTLNYNQEIYIRIALRSLNAVPEVKKAAYLWDIKDLITHIDINSFDKYGYSALYQSVYHGDIELSTFLLSHPKINIECGNKYLGSSPLMAAVLALDSNKYIRRGNSFDVFKSKIWTIAQLLVAHGANRYAKDTCGQTVSSIAFKYGMYDFIDRLDRLTDVTECSICLDDIKMSPSSTLSCAHVFHASCINNWKQSPRVEHMHCPMCRTSIVPV